MGLRRTFICTNCDYSVLVAGGRTRGFENITDTFICKDCKELVDIIIDNVEAEVKVEWMNDAENKLISCPACSSMNLEKWNLDQQNCPKCNGNMKMDLNGASVVWE